MSRKVTVTIKEHAGGLSIDLNVPAYMRESMAAVMAEFMVMSARQMGDDFAAEHGLPKSTMHAGLTPANPFNRR